jgi:hypothetical protein
MIIPTDRTIHTPDNEFLPREQVSFNLYLKMPVRYKEAWGEFKRNCTRRGIEFEDVLGDLIDQFNKGGIPFKRR